MLLETKHNTKEYCTDAPKHHFIFKYGERKKTSAVR